MITRLKISFSFWLGVLVRLLLVVLGKGQRAYLLDAGDLGGIGGALVSETVSTCPIRTAASAYPAADGVFVAFQGSGAQCPSPRDDDALTVLKIRGGSPPALATAYVGADDRLYAFSY